MKCKRVERAGQFGVEERVIFIFRADEVPQVTSQKVSTNK